MKLLVKFLAFIPFGISLLLLVTLYRDTLLYIHIPITILLAVIGSGCISNKKYIKQVGIGALTILMGILFIMGYYDSEQWFSTITGVWIYIYFIFINIAMKVL